MKIQKFRIITIVVLCLISQVHSGITLNSRSSYTDEKCSNINANELNLTSDQLFSYKDNLNYLYHDYFKLQSTSIVKYQVHAIAKDSMKSRNVTVPQKENPDKFNNVPGVIFNYLPFMAGLLITIILIPIILIFWCLRWKKLSCFNNSEKSYNKCQRYWPRILIGILLIIIFVFTVLGAVFSGLFVSTTKNTQCLVATITDSMVNGGNDAYGTFAGLSTIYSMVKQFPNQFTIINNLIPNFDTELQKLNSPLSTLRNNVKNIPDGSGGSVQLTYSTPIHLSSSTGQITSTFVNTLGSQTTTNSLIGTNIETIDKTNGYLTSISASSGNVATNSGTVIAQMNVYLANAQVLLNGFENLQKDTQANNFSLKPIQIVGILCIVYFGIVFLLTMLSIVSCVLNSFYESSKLKYFLYLSWILLAVFAVIGYVFSILFGYAYPYEVVACKFGDHSLQNKQNFKQSFQGIFTPLQLQFIGQCLPSQNGNIFPIVIGSNNVKLFFDDLTSLATNINSYAQYAPASKIDISFKKIGIELNNNMQTRTIDIADQTTYSKLQQISNNSKYSCSDTGFKTDSWIPSTQQLFIPCLVPGLNSTSTTCPLQLSFTTKSAGCTGCMDSNSFAIQNAAKSQSDIQTLIQNRYNNVASCNTFSTQLSNVWVNYYIKKNTVLGQVKTRYNSAQTQQQSTVSTLQSFQLVLLSFKTALNTLDSYTNSENGLLASLDCRVYGRKVVDTMNYACKNYISNSRMILVSTGIIALSISLLLCLLPCVTRRQQKSFQETGNQRVKPTSTISCFHNFEGEKGGQCRSLDDFNASATSNHIQN